MNDADFEAQEQRVRAYVDRWLPRLGLKWWRKIDVVYSRDPSVFEKPTQSGDCGASWEYKTAEVRFNLTQNAKESDAEVEDSVVHELVHVLLAAYDHLLPPEKHEDPLVEHTTVTIAQAFQWVRDFAAEGEMGGPVKASEAA